MTTVLPVELKKTEIVRTVAANPVTILVGETGSGKSTQVPKYLLEAGYQVSITQPRRLAARTVSERVSDELGTPLGDLAGYRTAEDRCDSPQTEVLFCTDGLQLVRELVGKPSSKRRVLVIDEVHEWNLNIDTLVAWVKYRLTPWSTLAWSAGSNFESAANG